MPAAGGPGLSGIVGGRSSYYAGRPQSFRIFRGTPVFQFWSVRGLNPPKGERSVLRNTPENVIHISVHIGQDFHQVLSLLRRRDMGSELKEDLSDRIPGG